jgi:integrase
MAFLEKGLPMVNALTAGKIKTLTDVGVHRIDHNLYLQITDRGGRSWLCRYMIHGKRRAMGLGSVRLVDLISAREAANDAKKLARTGVDPLAKRRAERTPAAVAKTAPTFKTFALDYIAGQRDGWKNEKHSYQWEQSLSTYAFPTIGDLPLDEVTVEHVLTILRPIWSTKSETASRVRGRIEKVLGAAEAKGHRQGANPAAWDGPLGHMLPPMSKVQKIVHHDAAPYAEVPALLKSFASREGEAARALCFVLLTATRSGEARGATWSEIDLKAKMWVIPAERMKMNKEHRVPLSDAALALLPTVPGKSGALVFPGARPGKPLSDMALLQLMRRVRGEGSTVHGLRSSFRDWAAEKTDFPREVVESSLAHLVGTEVERAYLRTTFFEKRRELMTAWAEFVVGGTK